MMEASPRDLESQPKAAPGEQLLGAIKTAMHISRMGAWEWDVLANRVRYSEELGPIFGLARGASHATLEDFLRAVHPADRERVEGAVKAALTGEADFRLEYRIIWPDGTLHWLADKGEMFRDAAGSPIRMVGSTMDVTDRKEAEENLRLSEERYRALYDDNPSMYFTVAPDGIILSVNEFGAQQLGYRKDELVGRTVLIVVHPDDHATVSRSLIQCREGKAGTVLHWEFRKVRKDGTVLWVREAARVIQGPEGRPVILVTCEDITDRKEAEDALRKRERQLRRAIAQRSRISQDLHDGLLQSLYAIGLGLEAARPVSPRNGKQSSRHIARAMSQLNQVMDDVRRFIEGLAPDPMQGDTLEATLKRLVRKPPGARQTKFAIDINRSAAKKLSAQQAFHITNIAQEAVSNCRRHARARTGSLSLRSHGGGTRLEITDAGVGFDPKEVRGRGHGLRNMRDRARQMGARMTIRSKMGQGTRILIDIPAHARHAGR
jgi:PAS domain S-box-containing protein